MIHGLIRPHPVPATAPPERVYHNPDSKMPDGFPVPDMEISTRAEARWCNLPSRELTGTD